MRNKDYKNNDMSMNNPAASSEKRHLLWNMIDPGDPYDIKKSLIARMPGDTRIFMGEHQELVLLFQAAEIQRLHESLGEYKLKFKEIERVELDRHSFEVQIKQLTERCGENEVYRQEIIKLKEFIRKQGLELDDVRKREEERDESLEKRYQDALMKLEIVLGDNDKFRKEIEDMFQAKEAQDRDWQEQKARWEEERADWKSQRTRADNEIRNLNDKILENELRLDQNNQIQAQLNEYEKKLKMLTKELERLQQLLTQKSRDHSQLQAQVKAAQTSQQRKDTENKQLQTLLQEREAELNALEDQMRKYEARLSEFSNINEKVMTYEQKLALITQEVERLSVLIQHKEREINELTAGNSQLESENNTLKRQYRDIEASYRDLQLERERLLGEISHLTQSKNNEIVELKHKVSNLTLENETIRRKEESRGTEYEQRLGSLLEEINRLNGVLRLKIGDLTGKEGEIAELQVRLQQYETENLQLRRKLAEGAQWERINEGLKGEIRTYKQELERTQSLLKASSDELEAENGQLKRKLRQQNETASRVGDMERTVNTLRSDLEAVNSGLRSRNDENTRLRIELSEVKQVNSSLSEENEGARRKLTESMNLNSDNYELKDRMTNLSWEIKRLNDVLKVKMDDNADLQQRLKMAEDSREEAVVKQENSRRTEVQLKSNISSNQQQISYLTQDNESNRNKLFSVEGEFSTYRHETEQKIMDLNREVHRLGQELRARENEYAILEEKYRIEVTHSSERVLRDSNHKISILQEEINRTNNLLRLKSDEAIRWETELREKELQTTNMRNQLYQLNTKVAELNRNKNAYEESLNEISRLNSKIKEQESRLISQGTTASRIGNLQEKILMLSMEIERLNKSNGQLSNQNSRLRALESSLNGRISQLERTKDQVSDEEISRLRREHTEYLRIAESAESQLRREEEVNKELSSQLRERDNELNNWETGYRDLEAKYNEMGALNAELDKRVGPMSFEIERLNEVLASKLGEYNQLLKRYHQLMQENEGASQLKDYMNEIERLNMVLSQKVNELNSLTPEYNNIMELYNQKASDNEDYENKIGLMASEIERLNEVLKTKIQGEQQMEDGFLQEIERLNNLLKLKVMESQEWQEQVNKSGETLKEEYDNLQLVYQQTLKECEGYKRRVSELEERFIRINDEFNRLNEIIRRLKTENEAFRQDNYNVKVELNQYQQLSEMNKKLSQEIDRLNKLKEQLEQDNADLKIHLSDESSLQRRINEYLALFVVLFAEIESLRVRVKDKERECEDVRRSSLAPFKL